MSTEPIITNEGAFPIGMPAPPDLKSRLTKHEQFASQFVAEKHDFIVYVPPMYAAEQERRFPVLYLNDGQNLFDPETSFIKGNYWRVGETADALIESGEIEPLIVVGIYNTGEKRIGEYTPVRDRRLGGGHADDYGRMVVDELKTFIDRTYRTLGDANNTGLGGSSLGGLVTMYLGLRYPRVFSKLSVMSPSVWWHSRAILKMVADLPYKPDQKIWLDIGTSESKRALPDARALKMALVRKGWHIGRDLAYVEVQGGQHTESAWAERVGPMLKFLFPRQ